MVMKLFSTRRSARLRALGSEACFCCSRQTSISVLVANPMSITALPTSLSRLVPAAEACALADVEPVVFGVWDMTVFSRRLYDLPPAMPPRPDEPAYRKYYYAYIK